LTSLKRPTRTRSTVSGKRHQYKSQRRTLPLLHLLLRHRPPLNHPLLSRQHLHHLRYLPRKPRQESRHSLHILILTKRNSCRRKSWRQFGVCDTSMIPNRSALSYPLTFTRQSKLPQRNIHISFSPCHTSRKVQRYTFYNGPSPHQTPSLSCSRI
jgi:hypothetical protein